jgi:hypothetical protein
MGNPRNNLKTKEVTEVTTNINPNDWKFMTLGSVAVRNGKTLVRENDVSIVLNSRNAELIRDAAQFILDHPVDADGKDQRISINASPFYEDSVSDKVLQYFSHRLYISADTIKKMGKTFSDYYKKAS